MKNLIYSDFFGDFVDTLFIGLLAVSMIFAFSCFIYSLIQI